MIFRLSRSVSCKNQENCSGKQCSRMSRVGCYGMTNADWLISPPAAQILPGLLRERVRMAKIKETERVRIPSLPAFFFVSRVTRDASACEKHFPPVIYGESGRRPPPRRFAPRGRTSPYSPEITGGTYIYLCTLPLILAALPTNPPVC